MKVGLLNCAVFLAIVTFRGKSSELTSDGCPVMVSIGRLGHKVTPAGKPSKLTVILVLELTKYYYFMNISSGSVSMTRR